MKYFMLSCICYLCVIYQTWNTQYIFKYYKYNDHLKYSLSKYSLFLQNYSPKVLSHFYHNCRKDMMRVSTQFSNQNWIVTISLCVWVEKLDWYLNLFYNSIYSTPSFVLAEKAVKCQRNKMIESVKGLFPIWIILHNWTRILLNLTHVSTSDANQLLLK